MRTNGATLISFAGTLAAHLLLKPYDEDDEPKRPVGNQEISTRAE